MSDELKPCPFCGKQFEAVEYADDGTAYWLHYSPDCPMHRENESGYLYISIEGMAEEINRRPVEDALRAECWRWQETSYEQRNEIRTLRTELEQEKQKHLEYATAYRTMAEANDAHMAELADVRAELAQAREAYRWIPVSERLPEPGTCLLMWIQPWSYVPGAEKLGAYMPTINPDEPWRSTWDLITYKPQEITHWMPLPMPPERACAGDTGDSAPSSSGGG